MSKGQFLDLGAINRLQERIACRKVAIQCSGVNSCSFRRICFQAGTNTKLEQALHNAVRLSMRAQIWAMPRLNIAHLF